MDFTLEHIMSHNDYVTQGDESPGLGLWEDANIRRVVLTKR